MKVQVFSTEDGYREVSEVCPLSKMVYGTWKRDKKFFLQARSGERWLGHSVPFNARFEEKWLDEQLKFLRACINFYGAPDSPDEVLLALHDPSMKGWIEQWLLKYIAGRLIHGW